LAGERIVPHYFTARDEPWLRALLGQYACFSGQKQSELHERLREPLPTAAPKIKLQIAILVLDALSRARPTLAVPAKEARAALFRAAAREPAPRTALLRSVAASLAVSERELESALFADLRSERRVAELPVDISPLRVINDANLAIVSSYLRRATHVRVVVSGNTRALLRHARVTGLICRVSRAERATEGVVLDVSGPFALFHHSELYGRALSSLIPLLARSAEFELTASCALGQGAERHSLLVRSGDPIGKSSELSRPVRRLEHKFERDFRRAAPGWDLSAEPSAIASGETLIFPDFALVPRHDPSRSWLLEILGFWTPEYLREKQKRLQAAGIERFLLCVDQNRECTEPDPAPDPRIIRYRSRIDCRALLAIITANS
jgi:hypothetical protein